MHVFADHVGVMIDPVGDGFSNANVNHATTIPDMRGIRISPRQSPVYKRTVKKIFFFFIKNKILFFSQCMVQLWLFIHLNLFIQHGGNFNMKNNLAISNNE
jgi:hypothetical protein